jgi:hypothetical protein
MGYPWTEKEIEILKEHFGKKPYSELTNMFYEVSGITRTKHAIANKGFKLGLRNEEFFWTPEEEECLKTYFGKIDISKVVDKLEAISGKRRKTKTLRTKAAKMGLRSERGHTWTEKEIEILKACYGRISRKEISEKIKKATGFDRSVQAVFFKADQLGLKFPDRSWSEEEDDCLETWYGNTKIEYLAARVSKISGIDRTVVSVKVRLAKLGLTHSLHASGKLNAHELSEFIGVSHAKVVRWIKKGYLKGEHRATFSTRKYWLVKVEDFWKFAAENRDKVDCSKIEPLTLIPEPDWFEEASRKDYYHFPKSKNLKWTDEEVHRLLTMYKRNKPSEEIAEELGRSVDAIKTKISLLTRQGVIHRDTVVHIPWSDREIELMYELEKQGLTDPQIAEELGRTFFQVASKRLRMKKNGEYKGFKNQRGSVKKA